MMTDADINASEARNATELYLCGVHPVALLSFLYKYIHIKRKLACRTLYMLYKHTTQKSIHM
jgi:hypothetical protein